MKPTKQRQVWFLGLAQARNLRLPLGLILFNSQGIPRMYCHHCIQRTRSIPLWFSVTACSIHVLDCRLVLSVVDNSSKEQVLLVALAVTLGNHIL
jgi:hypothetical protein